MEMDAAVAQPLEGATAVEEAAHPKDGAAASTEPAAPAAPAPTAEPQAKEAGPAAAPAGHLLQRQSTPEPGAVQPLPGRARQAGLAAPVALAGEPEALYALPSSGAPGEDTGAAGLAAAAARQVASAVCDSLIAVCAAAAAPGTEPAAAAAALSAEGGGSGMGMAPEAAAQGMAVGPAGPALSAEGPSSLELPAAEEAAQAAAGASEAAGGEAPAATAGPRLLAEAAHGETPTSSPPPTAAGVAAAVAAQGSPGHGGKQRSTALPGSNRKRKRWWKVPFKDLPPVEPPHPAAADPNTAQRQRELQPHMQPQPEPRRQQEQQQQQVAQPVAECVRAAAAAADPATTAPCQSAGGSQPSAPTAVSTPAVGEVLALPAGMETTAPQPAPGLAPAAPAGAATEAAAPLSKQAPMQGGEGQGPLPVQQSAPVGSGGGGSSRGTTSQHLPEQREEEEEEGGSRLMLQQQPPNVALRSCRRGRGKELFITEPLPASGGGHPVWQGPQQRQRAVGEGKSSGEEGGAELPAGEARGGVHEAWAAGAVPGLDLSEFPPGHAPHGPSSQLPPSTMVRGSLCVLLYTSLAEAPSHNPMPVAVLPRRRSCGDPPPCTLYCAAVANPLLSPHPLPGLPPLARLYQRWPLSLTMCTHHVLQLLRPADVNRMVLGRSVLLLWPDDGMWWPACITHFAWEASGAASSGGGSGGSSSGRGRRWQAFVTLYYHGTGRHEGWFDCSVWGGGGGGGEGGVRWGSAVAAPVGVQAGATAPPGPGA